MLPEDCESELRTEPMSVATEMCTLLATEKCTGASNAKARFTG